MDEIYIPGEFGKVPLQVNQKKENSFFEQYKFPLLIVGAGVVLTIGIIVFISSRNSSLPPVPQVVTIPSPTPTPPVTTIVGKINCTGNTCVANSENGQMYELHNLELSALPTGNGQVATLQVVPAFTSSQSGQGSSNNSSGSTSQQVSNIVTVIAVNGTPVPAPTSSAQSSSSQTPTTIPTPTPLPTNIKSTVDNASSINGQVVRLLGYLVSGSIGQEACTYMGNCTFSTLIVNDSAEYTRDTRYDSTIVMRASEKEEDYKTGQRIDMLAKVVVNSDGSVTFEKVY